MLKRPEKMFLMQAPMLRVGYALMPLVMAAIYLFGWRTLVLVGVVLVFGTAAEALFVFSQGKPVTSAVFVTCLIFSLSLPPQLPFWMAVVGIVVGVVIGKMAFGGFGHNTFNPAMVGRCFIYITFPTEMTGRWVEPMWGGAAGVARWTAPVDAITQATPLVALREGADISLAKLFLGETAGSLGEMSAPLILLGGAYILYKKAAPWRLALSCLAGGMLLSGVFYVTGLGNFPAPIYTLLSGSFLFGCAFVVTEPISGAKTKAGQWIYGAMVGGLTMVLRAFSNFSEGVMFAVLIMNAFVPLLDQAVLQVQALGKRPQGANP